MNNIDKLQEIAKNLHEINFGADGIIHPIGGGADYNFKHDCNKPFIHKYDECDKEGLACRACKEYEQKLENAGKRFTYVAHGAHTLDFIEAHKFVNGHEEKSVDLIELENWSTMPVMFVMENPANSKGNNYFGDSNYSRLPTQSWFWLNSDYKKSTNEYLFPNLFEMGAYGGLVFSIINTFHIANGYLTDSVKCGIGKTNNLDYITSTADYDHKIIKQCVEKHLKHELDALRGFDKKKRAIVFAFGDNAYYNMLEFLSPEKNNYSIVKLPHPRNRISNEYRKYVLFTLVAKTLHENGFYDSAKEKLDYLELLQSDKLDYQGHSKQKTYGLEELNKIIVNEILNSDFIKKSQFNVCAEATSAYIENTYTWQINLQRKSKNNPKPPVKDVVIRFKTKSGQKIDGYRVFWAQYVLNENSIYLYRGKKSSSDETIEEKDFASHEIYYLINYFSNIISEKQQSE